MQTNPPSDVSSRKKREPAPKVSFARDIRPLFRAVDSRVLSPFFLVGEQREAYLTGEPANDDRFIGVFAHELEHSGGYSAEDAASVARKLLPDILSYNPREPVRYPHNGRTLTDDVVDLFFSIYTNRKVTDKVGPHADLLDEFPYLGPPHSTESNSPNESVAPV
jgi:hypothetical protein